MLASGDQVLLPDNAYGPGKTFARHELARWGIAHAFYDPLDPASLAAAITPATKLVWLEAAGSVTLEFPDLRTLVRTARAKAPQAVLALDNTWGAGLAFDAFELGEGQGVDLTIHALTKYPSGGGDLLLGSVICRDDALARTLSLARSRVGHGVGVNDVEAVLRSLPSLPLALRGAGSQRARIRRLVQDAPEFAQCACTRRCRIRPGTNIGSRIAALRPGWSAVEIDPQCAPAQADAFVDALRLFRIGWSWGGPISLVAPYHAPAIRNLPTPYRGALVRFCLGLEAVDDLIADAEQALPALGLR